MIWSWRTWLKQMFLGGNRLRHPFLRMPRRHRARPFFDALGGSLVQPRFQPLAEQLEARDLPSLIINPTFDSTITSDPNAAAIETTIKTSIQNFEEAYDTPITLNITYAEMSSGLGESIWGVQSVSYSQYRSHLAAVATSAAQISALGTLPSTTTNPVNGSTQIDLQTAAYDALGFGNSTINCNIDLNTSICNISAPYNQNGNDYDLLATVEHETDECMGIASSLNGLSQGLAGPAQTGAIFPEDLYRYSAAGTRSFDTITSTNAYFSDNGGTTDLARFNQDEGGDMNDWYSTSLPSTPQVQDAFQYPASSYGGSEPNLGVEYTVENVLGFALDTTLVSIDSSGNLVISNPTYPAISGIGAYNDSLTIQANTSLNEYVITDPNAIIGAYNSVFTSNMPGATTSANYHTVDVPFADVTGSQISVNTGAGTNSVTLDYSAGNFPKPVVMTGGSGTNTLTLENGSFATDTYAPSGAAAGTITLPTQSVSFSNVSVVNDLTPTTTLETIQGTSSGDTINIVNGNTVNSTTTTQVNSGNHTFPTINFAHKATVTVNGLAGNDTFTINNPTPAAGLTALNVDSGVGTDSFSVLTTPAAVTTSVLGGGPGVSVNVGNSNSVQLILGMLNIDSAVAHPIAITVNDSADTTASTFALSSNQIQGLAPANINYVGADTQSLTIDGGTGGNTVTVNSAAGGITTILNSGNGSDAITVNPIAATASLNINGQLPYPSAGNTLFYTGPGTYSPGAPGAGTITQSGQGTVTFSNISSVSVGASTSLSFVSVTPTSIISGNTATVILQARDASGANENTGGLTVAFTLGGGTATGNFGSVAYIGNGQYQATFTAVGAGSNTVTATINGVPLTSTAPTITITPGSFSLANSLVTVASPSDVSGAADQITLTEYDGNGNPLTTSSGAVAFAFGSGTSTGTISAVTDHGNGTFTANFTGVLVGTARTITATINSNAVTSTLPTITVTPGAASLANSIVTVQSATDASGTADTLTLTTYDAAGNALATGGATVVFGLGSGTSTGTVSGTTDNGNGTYSATFTGILVGSATTITATLGGSAVTSTPAPTITVIPGAVSLSQSTFTIAPTSITAGNSATVTLVTRDAAGNLETTGGQTVAFGLGGGGTSSGTFTGFSDHGNGTYSETFNGTTAGTPRTITATIGGSNVTSTAPTITVTPGAFSLATSSVTVAQSSLSSYSVETVTLTVRDANGNQEVNGGGLSVVFSVGTGTSTGILSAATDMGNGTFTATFTGLLAGTPTQILATIGGSPVTSTAPTIAVTPGAFSLTTSTVTVAQSSIQSGSTDAVTLTARDAAGNQLTSGGLIVGFGASGGGSTGNFSAVTDHGNGTYTAIFTGVLAGTPTTITGSIVGSNVTSTLPTIAVTPGAVSLAQSVVAVVPTSIQSGSAATITLTAKDAAGNQETGGGLTVVFGLGAGTSTGTFSGFTDNGNGTYSETFTGVLAGTARTITATIGGNAITSTLPTITVTPGAVSLATSTLTVGQPFIASGNTDLVLLTTRDAAGNLEPAGLSVAFNLGSGTSTGALSGVTDLGNGSYAATFTGALVGTARTITATIGGNAITSTLPTITVTPGAVSLATSTVAVTPASIQSGSTATITLTTRDADGNLETTGGQTVAFGLGAGTSGGTLSNFQDDANGTYTETFTGGAAGTPTTITATIAGTSLTSTLPTITVTPGPVSLANSFVTDVPSSIPAGTTTTVTLTTEDAFGNRETAGGHSVVFGLGGGTAGGSFSPTTDLGNGTYTATFTSDATVGTNTITAAIDGSLVTSAAPGLTVTPATFDLATSNITVAPASVASGSNTTVTLTARDAFGNQEPTGGLIVTFGLGGTGAATGTFSGATDNHNGTYTATFTGILAGGNTIAAYIGGIAVTSGNPAVTVVPGPYSLAASTVAIAPASITSGSTATITLTARDAAGNQEASGGLNVSFALGSGSSSGTLSSVTDVGNGTYTAVFTGTTAGTPRTITADIGSSPLLSAFPAITVTPGTFSPAQSTISLAPSSIQSGGVSTVTLIARDADGNQETNGGLTVAFALSGAGSATGSFGATTDNHNGTYTATFTGLIDGSNSVTATINTQAVTSGNPTITVTPGAVSLAQSTVAIVPGTIASGGVAVVTLTARDANGNQETSGGLSVAFGLGTGTASGSFLAVSDNHNGTYTANFTGIVAGSNTVTATINTLGLTSPAPFITVTPGPVSLAQSTVSIAPGSIQSGSSAAITLVARDANGNQETAGGLTVVFGLAGGSATGSFGAVTDHGNGVYTGSFTGILAGNNSIAATINTQSVTSGNPFLTVTPGPFNVAQSSVAIVPASIPSGAATTVTLTARDAAGNQETNGGLTVAFNLGAGSATGSFSAVTDHGNGTYTSTFTGILAGSNTLVGTVDTQTLASTAPSITVTPGAYSLAMSTLTATPGSVQSGSTATITLTARDAAGNQETGGGQIVTLGFGGGTSTGTLTAVTDNGNGTYSATFTGILAGSSRTITAAINGAAVTSALPTVTVTPGAFNLAQSTVSAAPTSIQSGSNSTITLTARDAAGNQETTGGLSVAFNLGAGSGTGAFGPIVDNGNGTYSATFTGGLAGARAIVGSINAQSLTSTPPTVTVTPGAFSLANSTLSVVPGTIQSGGSTTITLTVRDAAGNQETSGGLSVTFGLGSGSATGAFSAFTDNHNGTYSETFTGILAGTSTLTASIGGNAITSTLPSITVTPGAISVSQSTVTVTPGSIASATTATVTLTARDADGNLESTGGLAVSFGLGVGSATGNFGAVTDNGNGTYTALLTGVRVGTNSIIATINGQGVTSAAPSITVTPGAVSLAQSTVAIAPADIQSGGSASVVLTARDANGNLETTGGLTVGFGLGAGAASGSFGAVTDNHNGTYSATFVGVASGVNTVTATINSQATTAAAPTITVTPGSFSLSQSTISVAPASFASGGTTTVTLTARDADGNQETTGGLSVTFGLGVGTATGAFTAVADLGDGIYTATFTGILAGTNTITAKIDALTVTSTQPTITVTPGAISLSQSTVAIAPASIQSGSTATVTLTARDANGNLETPGGATVVFGLSGSATGNFGAITDNHDGTYTASFTGLVVGTSTVTASINAQSLISTLPAITVTPGAVSLAQSTVTVAPGSIQSGSTTTVTLTARDANGNAETTGGLNVAFTLGAGSAAGPLSAVTDHGNGTYTAIFTGIAAGTNTVDATINTLAVTSAAPTVSVTPGPLSLAESSVTITPASLASGSTATITLTTRDANGNQETSGGGAVAFNLGAGTATGFIGSVTDHGNGTYTAPFTGILVGTNTLSATYNAQAVTSTAPALTVTPGPFSLSQSTVTIAPVSIQSGSTAVVTLTARDAAGNQETAGGLSAGFALVGSATTGTFSVVTDHNNGIYTAVFTGLTASTNAVKALLNAQTLTSAAAPITVTPGPVSALTSTIAIAPASVQAGNSAVITLTARDSGGDQETSGGLLVSFGFGAGNATGSISAVTDNHNGTYSATFIGIAAGTRVITATINGQAVTSALPTITVTPGPVSISQSSVTVAPGSIQAGTSAIVILTARDPNGNLETAGGLTVSFALAGGSATGTFGPITDNHDGTYTASFTGNLAGTNAIAGFIAGQALTTGTPTITVTSGAVSLAGSTITVAPASIPVGGLTTVTLTAADAYGNRESTGGAAVAFTLGAGNITGTFASVTDNHDGTYSATFTAGASAGSSLIAATINGQAVTSPEPTLTLTPGPVNLTQSVVTLAPASIAAGGQTIFTLTTKDAHGNHETSGGLTVSFGLGAGTAAGTFSNVIDHGDGTYSATFTSGPTAGSNTVTATIDGQYVQSVAPELTVTPGPVSLSQSVVTLTPAVFVVGSTTTVTLTAEDARGNQETTGGLTVTFGLGGGAGSGTFSSVTDNQDGTYTAIFTGTVAGANTITATIGGQGVTSAAPTVTVNPAPTTTSLSVAPFGGSVYGAAVSLTAVVAPAGPTSGTPTGSVSFYDGNGNFLGSGPVNGGVATLTTTALPAFTQTLTDTYSGDANFASSSGAFSNYNVTPGHTAITVAAAPASHDVFGQLVTLTANLTDADGNAAVVNGGTVSFYDSGVFLGTSGAVTAGVATLATSALAVNSNHTITAVYSGSANFSGVTGTLQSYAVTAAGTGVSIVSSAPVSGFGQAVAFTATVAAASPSVAVVNSGAVSFYDGTVDSAHLLGTSGAVTAGQATFTTTSLSRATHSIIAVYTDMLGDFAASQSSALVQTVIGADSIGVSSSPATAVFGQPVTFTITVTGAGGIPGGTVQILQGGSTLGSPATLAGGTATITLNSAAAQSAFAIGANPLVVSYLGNSTFAPNTASYSQQVARAATTTALSPTTASAYGQAVTFTATVGVNGPGAGALAGGIVNFNDGGTVLGSGTLNAAGVATYTTTNTQLPVGAASITASYVASTDLAGSVSAVRTQTVNAAGTATTLASSAPGGSIYTQSVAFTATVTAAASALSPGGGSVKFYNGAAAAANLLGSASLVGGVATFSTAGLQVANHTITAVYSGAAGFAASTGTLGQSVVAAGTNTALVSSQNSPNFGQAVSFTATVNVASPGTGKPTGGTVHFYDGASLIGSTTLTAAGTATFTTAALAANPDHAITAVYSGAGNYAGSTSSVLNQAVNPAATTVTLATSATTVKTGQTLTFSASVKAASGGVATGSVTFVIDGGVQVFTRNLVNGAASLSFAGFTSPGPHTIQAVYNATANFASGLSTTANVTALAASTVALSSSANTAITGNPVTITAQVAGSASVPAGTVSFYNGTTLLGIFAVDIGGFASITLTNLAIGTHNITAVYSGDPIYAGSTSGILRQVISPKPSGRLV